MAPIATYVFLDLETSGLPQEELNKTKITELSMVAVKKDHLLESAAGTSPRVQHKLTLCFNPGRVILPGSSKVTGLTNELLEHEPYFTKETFKILSTFLNMLTKPVCLIAQNGENFDFPILKNHLVKIGESFPSDLMCADCYHAFYDILEAANSSPVIPKEMVINVEQGIDTVDSVKEETAVNDGIELYALADTLQMKKENETTPKHQRTVPIATTPRKDSNRQSHVVKARRKFPFSKGSKPKDSYKLKHIYERLLNRPAIDAHRAENDCIFALECSVAIAKDFVKWIDENHRPFEDVKPMTLGVPLGLLTLTGLLWGCTNPFIKRGTKGLRQVSAGSWMAQIKAELVFLLTNWRYVIPFLINQLGSLSYLIAVRVAPLSVAVPVSNGLAFALTATTAAALGDEQPLDIRSVLGIALIVTGTALCCWDKT